MISIKKLVEDIQDFYKFLVKNAIPQFVFIKKMARVTYEECMLIGL